MVKLLWRSSGLREVSDTLEVSGGSEVFDTLEVSGISGAPVP